MAQPVGAFGVGLPLAGVVPVSGAVELEGDAVVGVGQVDEVPDIACGDGELGDPSVVAGAVEAVAEDAFGPGFGACVGAREQVAHSAAAVFA